MRCEEPVKILEILRLTENGHSQREISTSIGCARSTVGEVQRRCREIGLCYEKASVMTSEALQKLLYPASAGKKYIKPEPDYDYIYKELQKHPNLNLRFLWEEYKAQNPNGLEYSQFCERYNRWKGYSGKNLTMHQEREAGKELFVDWMGVTLPLIIDPSTGEICDAHFFVCTLGNSGYPYVEAFPDEKLDKWLLAHTHAFEYYGGVPRIVVPDNCKTAVTKPQHYDPVINPAYWELAKHYNVAVIPARIREPQDKAPVEEGVRWLETWLLGWLRNQQFFSFGELNSAIRYRLSELVRRPYQKRPGTRLSVFNELDRPKLRPLALSPFETADMKLRTVPDNYHVEYDGFYYSVPYTSYRQKVTIRATSTSIEVFDSNRIRIASHARRYCGKRYVTDPAHMPEHHRKYWDAKQFNGSRYRLWAENIGENTLYVIDKMLTAQKIEEQAYKSCMGLLQMSKKYSPERLETACTKAKAMNSCTYTTVANILKNGQDFVKPQVSAPQKATPSHENVRGAAYYT
ncbi:IS21 family transposase [Pelotomaculum terephthalicicum JT]|uniref:IS21 family transposase n=1 Tax=Pelotomaculum terephthalicicum TaxID=206393 RepID=UPI001F04C504|nr:IS21 family transposase [Pelotomaculum terephthalicicum]MCG9968387.1 IS21 family transposase [Pelotomaculum terephthalicicum JT]